MIELLDEQLPEDPTPPPSERWRQYRKALLIQTTRRRLLSLLGLLVFFVGGDYYWGRGLMVGEFLWGIGFYIAVAMLYVLLALSLDFSEAYQKSGAIAFVGSFGIGLFLFMVILGMQADIEGSIDPRAATAIVAWRWSAVLYVLISEIGMQLAFFRSFNQSHLQTLLSTKKQEMDAYLGKMIP